MSRQSVFVSRQSFVKARNFGLPLHRDVDFVIELHPSTSPISITLHRMASIEL